MNQHDVEAAFLQALLDHGLVPDEKEGLIMDGLKHRAHAIDSKHTKNLDGNYIGYLDGVRPAGFINNFFLGTSDKWKYEGQVVTLTVQQKQDAVQAMAANQARREQERATAFEEAAQAAQRRWDHARPMAALDVTPYLARKQVGAFDVRREGDNLLVPVRDLDGKLWSIQTIFPEKKRLPKGNEVDKVFSKNSQKEGHLHIIGAIEPGQPLLVAEGYATGASAYMASGHTTAIAFASNNLDAVVGALKGRHPDSPIVILGDDDIYTVQGNAGRNKALAAAEKHQVGVVFPTFTADGKFTDFNDLHVAEGLAAVTVQLESAIQTINQGLIVDKTPANDQQQPIAHPFAERLLREQANLDAQRVAAEKKPEPVPVAPAEQVKIDEALRDRIHARTRDWNPTKPMSNDQARKIMHRDLADLGNIKSETPYMNACIAMAEARRNIPAYRIQFDKQVKGQVLQDVKRFNPPSFDEKVIAAAAVSAAITAKATAAKQAQEQAVLDATNDGKLFSQIEDTANIVISAPKNALSREEAILFVANDMEALGGIKDAEIRKFAIETPIAEMAFAQAQYKAELERQAPDIAALVNKEVKQTKVAEPVVEPVVEPVKAAEPAAVPITVTEPEIKMADVIENPYVMDHSPAGRDRALNGISRVEDKDFQQRHQDFERLEEIIHNKKSSMVYDSMYVGSMVPAEIKQIAHADRDAFVAISKESSDLQHLALVNIAIKSRISPVYQQEMSNEYQRLARESETAALSHLDKFGKWTDITMHGKNERLISSLRTVSSQLQDKTDPWAKMTSEQQQSHIEKLQTERAAQQLAATPVPLAEQAQATVQDAAQAQATAQAATLAAAQAAALAAAQAAAANKAQAAAQAAAQAQDAAHAMKLAAAAALEQARAAAAAKAPAQAPFSAATQTETERYATIVHNARSNQDLAINVKKISAESAEKMVASDVSAYHSITDLDLRKKALHLISNSSHSQSNYKDALLEQAPAIAEAAFKGTKLEKTLSAPQAETKAPFVVHSVMTASQSLTQAPDEQQTTLNSIERGPSRTQAPVAGKAAAPQPDLSKAMPAGIEKKYIKVENTYHHADQSVAFVDLGQKLTTKEANQDVIRSLVAIAKARQWDSIAVKGSEEFRRAAWMSASLENLPSTGYTPSQVELADLAKKMGQQVGPKVDVSKTVPDNSIERGPQQTAVVTPLVQPAIAPVQAAPVQAAQAPAPAATATQAPQPAAQVSAPIKLPEGTGKLVAHGPAPFMNDPKKGESYFVTIETEQGKRRTEWGTDLKRAMAEANVNVGDTILVEKVGREPVTAKERTFDQAGNETGVRDIDTIKNQWQVGSITKAAAFANEKRDAAIARHAELAPAYGMMKLAEEAAKAKYPHNQSYQHAFQAGVKTAVAQMIARGEQYPAPDIKEKQVQTKDQTKTPPPKEQEMDRA